MIRYFCDAYGVEMPAHGVPVKNYLRLCDTEMVCPECYRDLSCSVEQWFAEWINSRKVANVDS